MSYTQDESGLDTLSHSADVNPSDRWNRALRAWRDFRTGASALLLMVLLFGACVAPAHAKVIGVIPGQTTQALATWYILNCSTSGGVGSYQLDVAPMYGTVTFGSGSGVAPGCPTGSPSLPATIAYYTMNTGNPAPSSDYFHLNYILNGAVAGSADVYVVNSSIVGKLQGAPCNCSGKSPVTLPTGPNDAGGDGLDAGAPALGIASSRPASGPLRVATEPASGNVFYSVTDYTTAGQNPLTLTRYYNSINNLATQVLLAVASNATSSAAITSSTLALFTGVNWRTNYDRYLRITSLTTVIAERPDGQQLNFTLTGSVWQPDSDVDMTLTQSGSQWILTDQDDTVETYTDVPLAAGISASAQSAQLNSIRTRNGYTQTLSYSNGSLASVTDSYNRTLNLAYSNGLLQMVTTPDNSTMTYGYTTASSYTQLTSVTYSTTPSTKQTYLYELTGQPTLLTGITDEDGNRYATWGYDAAGRGISSELGSGAYLTSTIYNSDGSRVVSNALGVKDTYKFTTLQNVPKVTEISRAATSTTAAGTETFTYDANGYLASATDWNGNLTTYVNNGHGEPTSIEEAVGTAAARNTAITYDATWVHLPATITTAGITSAYSYDGNGELLTNTLTDTTAISVPYSTRGQTRTRTMTWSAFRLASVQTPNGNTTTFGYDSSGALTSITDALSHVTNITAHTGGGLPETIVDPNGVTTTLTYDGRQRPTSSTVSGTSGTYKTSWAYDAAGNLVTTRLPDGSYLTNTYDSAHRLTKVTDALGNYISFTLDALGDRTQTNVYKSGATLTWQASGTFDAFGRELVDTGGAGQTITRTYDQNGNVLSVKDGLSHTTTNSYDGLNRLSASTDADNGVTTPAYDTHNRIVRVTDANGNATSYIRDGFGDVIEQISPDSGTSVFHYDSDANLTSKTDALGVVTNQTFDALDRPLTTTYPADTAENVAYVYDQTATGFSFGVGRLTSVTDAAGSLTRAYEERGNLISEKRVNGTTTLLTGYTYDGANRVASLSYPDGSVVTYKRDAAGYVSTVSAVPAGSSTTTTLATLTHQPFGPLNGVTYGNGIAEAWTFDSSYRPTHITDKLAAVSLQNLTYSYDVSDNVKSITDAVTSANSQTFGYDVVNRLNSAASGTGGYGSFAWSYDKVGNRLTQEQGTAITTYGYTSGTNRLATITTSTAKASVRLPHGILSPDQRHTTPALAAIAPSPVVHGGRSPSQFHPRLTPAARALGWPMLLLGLSGLLGYRRRLLHHRLLAVGIIFALLTGSTAVLIGCANGTVESSTVPPAASLSLSGHVHGGQQPVIGATIQLYAVGTTGTASASTTLLKTAVHTDANGSFSLTSDYTCPAATTQVYLTATGGNPGLSSGTNNTASAMMAALGPCGSLTASTYIWVNEVTTIGSLAALYPYTTSVANVGSASTSAAQLATAFAAVSEYTNTTNGTAPGPTLPAGYYASSTEIYTLGNIIAACINSAGGAAGDGSACGSLFTLATPVGGTAPTDTVGAILDILKNPTLNVLALFDLSGAVAPFQPSLTSAPANWSLPIIGIPPPPTFSVPTGTYTSAQMVTISDTATTASIYYTVDGSIPTRASNLYTAPIAVASSETIQAIAVQEPTNASSVATVTYTINTVAGSMVNVLTNANGNTTGVPSADGVSYVTATYNKANRLASVTGTPVAASYVYDWAGQRYSKTEGGIPPTIFSYAQGGTLIAENNNGVVTDYVYVDGRPIATLQPAATPAASQITYVHADRLGTPQLVTNTSGSTVWSTTYQPFGTTGAVTASSTQDLRFPGQYADTETGFDYNLNRDYMPNLGRYLETDQIGLLGGPNDYVYVNNTPLKLTDPTGLADSTLKSTRMQPRNCNETELNDCERTCGTKGVESCKVPQSKRLTRMTGGGLALFQTVDGPVSCSCNDPEDDGGGSFCSRNPKTCIVAGVSLFVGACIVTDGGALATTR